MAETVMSKMDPRIVRAINDTTHCANKCIETFNHCLHMGGKYADPSHLNSLLDCVDLCRVGAGAMLRGSEFIPQISFLNTMLCERCAESCFRTAPEDEHMKECAELCRLCADSCRELAKRYAA